MADAVLHPIFILPPLPAPATTTAAAAAPAVSVPAPVDPPAEGTFRAARPTVATTVVEDCPHGWGGNIGSSHGGKHTHTHTHTAAPHTTGDHGGCYQLHTIACDSTCWLWRPWLPGAKRPQLRVACRSKMSLCSTSYLRLPPELDNTGHPKRREPQCVPIGHWWGAM